MKKLLFFSIICVVFLAGFAFIVSSDNVSASYNPQEGDLIRIGDDPAVYSIGPDGARRLFVNEPTFWSHYTGTWGDLRYNDEDVDITTISQNDFDSIDSGDNMTVRAGSRLIRFENSNRIFAVYGGVNIRQVDGDEARDVYGSDWSSTAIVIQGGFETDYTRNGNDFVDSDNDGLSDDDESNIYGTDPTVSDSDGDGYTDGIELIYDFDPVGSGRLDDSPENCEEDWTCRDWTDCIGGKMSRICTDANSCNTAVDKPDTTQLCDVSCSENWTCRSWGSCSNGTQSRTCTDFNSCGTTSDRPDTTRPGSCPACEEDWTCRSWGSCSDGRQSRTCTDRNSCGTTSDKPDTTQTGSCPACVEDWSCGDFSTCSGGTQSRTCTDANSCSTTVVRPILSQTCTDACVEDWVYGDWGVCDSDSQSRTATDNNSCGTTDDRYSLTQDCDSTSYDNLVLNSFPYVIIESSNYTLAGYSVNELIDVVVVADDAGPIGLYKMTFLVYAQDVEVSDFDMIAQGDSVASESDGSITVTDQGDYKVVEVYPKMPTSDDIITIPETDGGDRDKRFILRAFVTGRVSYISTSVLGDAGYEEGSYYDTASVIDGTKNDDFIWSDLPDFNFGDEVDVTNEQWLNGFIIDSAGGFVSTTSSAKVI